MVSVDALDRDADLAAVREAAEHDRSRRSFEVAVFASHERRLAPELHRARNEARPARRGDLAPGLDGASEDAVVDPPLDERLPCGREAEDDAEEVFGQARRVVDLLRLHQDERRDLAWFDHARVAGDQRLDDRAHREHEREVPRRDHSDDAPRNVVHLAGAVLHEVQLLDLGGEGLRRTRRGPPDEIEQRSHLVHERLVARLSALEREEVDELVGPLGHGVAQPQEALSALLHREHGPRLLRLARPRDRARHLVGGGHRDLAYELARGRRIAPDAIGRRARPGPGRFKRGRAHDDEDGTLRGASATRAFGPRAQPPVRRNPIGPKPESRPLSD